MSDDCQIVCVQERERERKKWQKNEREVFSQGARENVSNSRVEEREMEAQKSQRDREREE